MMQTSKEYAQALFALASEESCKQEIFDSLAVISAMFEENKTYLDLLSSPAIPIKERLDAIDAAFSSLNEYAISFLKLLCERSYIRMYPVVATEFNRLFKEANKMITAKVKSAVPLSEAEQSALAEKLTNKYGHPVTLELSVDATLLGGIVIETDGRVYDASLRRQLRDLKDVISR